MLATSLPIPYFFGLDGTPLDGGSIYFGLENQNPVTAPIAAYWDAAGTQPAAQPIKTVNGWAVRSGTPAQVFIESAYSVLIRDGRGRTVTYSPTSTEFSLYQLLSTAGAGKGADFIPFMPPGAGAIARTLTQALIDQFSVSPLWYALPGTPVDGSADWQPAFDDAIAYATANGRRPILRLPAGIFPLDSISLDSVRGFQMIGEAGADPVSANGRTWIYWKAGTAADHLMVLKSSSYLKMQSINFYSNGNTGKTSMVEFQCNGESTAPPRNKFASSYVVFDDCALVVPPSAPMSVATVVLKSALGIKFRRCPIYGTNAVKIGADTDIDPITSEATIPDGRAVGSVFEDCPIFGNIILERVLGLTMHNPYFGANSVPFAAGSYRVAYWSVSGNQEIRNLQVDGLICDTANVTHNVPVWFPAINAPAVEPSAEFTNCQLAGAGTIFDLASGNWIINGNKFIGEQKPGVTTWRAIRLGDGVKKFEADLNDYDGLMALNTTSVVAVAINDNRTSLEDRRFLLARGRATGLTLANNSFAQVLSRTIDHLEGGLVEVSYHLTISSTVDSAFIARIVVDGVAVAGTYAQVITNTASAKTFVLSLSPRIVRLAATDLTSSRVIELQVQQVSGASFATIRGDDFINSDTFALVKVVA